MIYIWDESDITTNRSFYGVNGTMITIKKDNDNKYYLDDNTGTIAAKGNKTELVTFLNEEGAVPVTVFQNPVMPNGMQPALPQ